jgi:hypothetical protein
MKKLFASFGLMAVALFMIIAPSIIGSHMEAAAYNRITGAHVTAWDAFWCHLRVELPAATPTPTPAK